MGTSTTSTVVLEQWQVAPSPGGATEMLLPLLDFDVMVLHFRPMQTLYFYDLQLSKSDFVETFVPTIKNSLSITLKHFLPLAGKIILPLTTSSDPVCHYVGSTGDSVSLTIAQCDADFDNLTSSQYRNGDDFYGLVPKLARAHNSGDSIRCPVAAFQVTLFPDRGICVGVTIHHAIGDGATLVFFVRAWSLIAKFKGESRFLASHDELVPFYDRSGMEERLPGAIWKRMRKSSEIANFVEHRIAPPEHSVVRATLTLGYGQIRRLKRFVLNKLRRRELTTVGSDRVTSYVVVCAFLWSCWARSSAAGAEDVDEPAYIVCGGDCRGRLGRPLPSTYFGNCVAVMVGESTLKRLRDKEEGMAEAAVAVAEVIQNTFNKRYKDKKAADGVIDVSSGLQKLRKLNAKRVFYIVGSPKFDMDFDFGWGKTKAIEAMHADHRESAFLVKSIGSEEGVQIGLSMSKPEMDAFTAVFRKGITESAQLIVSSKL